MAKSKNPAQKKRPYTVAEFAFYVGKVMQQQDPEVVLLKGHLLVEHLLMNSVAARLRVAPEAIPRLPFSTLIDLAFLSSPEEDRVDAVRFNALRNALAHEYHAMNEAEFLGQIRSFGVSWPADREMRARILKLLTHFVALLVWLAGESNRLPDDPDRSDPVVAKESRNQADTLRAKLRADDVGFVASFPERYFEEVAGGA